MSSKDQQQHASLWQALCWLTYGNPYAHAPKSDRSLRNELTLNPEIQGHKTVLLKAVRDSKLSFEGKLGARCDPPPSPVDTWENFHWTGHAEDYRPVEPKDWPSEFDAKVIDWQASVVRTPRGEFIDVRCSLEDLRVWHPGPGGDHKVRPNRRGRKKGSGSYAEVDAPLIQAMKDRFESADDNAPVSIWAAAMEQAPNAKGTASLENRAKRLVKRFNAE